MPCRALAVLQARGIIALLHGPAEVRSRLGSDRSVFGRALSIEPFNSAATCPQVFDTPSVWAERFPSQRTVKTAGASKVTVHCSRERPGAGMENTVIALSVGVAVAAIVLVAFKALENRIKAGKAQSGPWGSTLSRPSKPRYHAVEAVQTGSNTAIETDFRKVFMLTSQEGKEALISDWMQRKNCNRVEAMRLAVEEWRRDNR